MRKKIVESILGSFLLLTLITCARTPLSTSTPTEISTSSNQVIPVDVLIIVNGTIIDGTGADPISDGAVVVWGDQIVAIGRQIDFNIPGEANIIDAKGGTILPGIINAHTHATADPATRRFAFLLKGVTSICDMGVQLESMSQFEQNDNTGPSARGFQAGPIITAPGGYPDTGNQGHHLNYEVANIDEARTAVLDLVARGVDYIKIALEPGPAGYSWPVLSLQEVSAIVEEAHAHGLLVRAHVTMADQLDFALDAGIDVIEHLPIPQLSEADWKIATADTDHIILPADYQGELIRMIQQNVTMVPTLSVMPTICNMNWYGMPQEFRPMCANLFLEVVRQFHDMGGMIAVGNDYGNQGAEPGTPLGEMQFLIQVGLTPLEVIQAGTSRAATVCGHGDELGTLEVGKLADLIVVDGDPLKDIEVMNRVVTVIQAGIVVYP